MSQLQLYFPPNFAPSHIIYFSGSYWWDSELRHCEGHDDFFKLLEVRLGSLRATHNVEEKAVTALRDCIASRYYMLACCLVDDFQRYCGLDAMKGDHPSVGLFPKDRMIHVLLSIKVLEALFDSCRGDDDFETTAGVEGVRRFIWPVIKRPPTTSDFREQTLDSFNDLARLWSAVENVDQGSDHNLRPVSDPVYASLLGQYQYHATKATGHAFIARLLKLAFHLRGFLLKRQSHGQKDPAWTSIISGDIGKIAQDLFSGLLMMKRKVGSKPRGDFENLRFLYEVAVFGPNTVFQARIKVKSTLKDLFYESFFLEPAKREAWLIKLNRKVWRMALELAVTGTSHIETKIREFKALKITFTEEEDVMHSQFRTEDDDKSDQSTLSMDVDDHPLSQSKENQGNQPNEIEAMALVLQGQKDLEDHLPSPPNTTITTQALAHEPLKDVECPTSTGSPQGFIPSGTDASGGVEHDQTTQTTPEATTAGKDPDPTVDDLGGAASDLGSPFGSPLSEPNQTTDGHDLGADNTAESDATDDELGADAADESAESAAEQSGADGDDGDDSDGSDDEYDPDKKRYQKRPRISLSTDKEINLSSGTGRPDLKLCDASWKAESSAVGQQSLDSVLSKMSMLSLESRIKPQPGDRWLRDVPPLPEDTRESLNIFKLRVSLPILTDKSPRPIRYVVDIPVIDKPRLMCERGDYSRILAQLRAAEKTDAADPEGCKPGSVIQINAAEWDKKTPEERQQLLTCPFVIKAERNIYATGILGSDGKQFTAQHFVNGLNCRDRKDGVCSDVLSEDLGRVPSAKVQIQDVCQRPISHDGHQDREPRLTLDDGSGDSGNMLFCGTIDRMENYQRGILNCLDMPLKRPLPPDFSVLTDSHLADQIAYQLGFVVAEAPSPGFILYGKWSAVSRIHVDSDGFASLIELVCGAKLWIFMTKGTEPDGHPTASASNWRNFANAEYNVVLVETGDRIYMPPGTFHSVLTIRDSVSTGNMFFLPLQLRKTFFTMVQLHLDGQRISNSDYRGAQLGLFRLAGYYATILQDAGLAPDDSPPKPWTNDEDRLYQKLQSWSKHFSNSAVSSNPFEKNLRVPPLEDLVALICIVTHSEELTPQQSENEPLNPLPMGYKQDRQLGQKYARLILNRVIRRIPYAQAFYNQLEEHCKTTCSSTAHQHRHQRDLPEVGEPIDKQRFFVTGKPGDPDFTWTFLHDDEHESRARSEGRESVRPKHKAKPGKRKRSVDNIVQEGCELEEEWSDGEPIPPLIRISPDIVTALSQP